MWGGDVSAARQAAPDASLALHECLWEDLLLLGAGELGRVRRFLLEHVGLRNLPAQAAAEVAMENLLQVRWDNPRPWGLC